MFAVQRWNMSGVAMLTLLVLSLVAGQTVRATPGNGAIQIRDFNCHDDDGYTTCMAAEGVANETMTPSGNAIYFGQVRTTFTLMDPGGRVVYEGDSQSHFQRLDKDELLHMLSQQVRSTMTRSDGITCTFIYQAHLANGQIQFEHSETECQ